MFVWRILFCDGNFDPRTGLHGVVVVRQGLEEKHVKLETNDNVGNIASRRRKKTLVVDDRRNPGPLLLLHRMGRGRQGVEARWRFIKHI